MELMIIECKECGNAYKGDISKPFLCPKCISEGVMLPGMVQENNISKIKKPILSIENNDVDTNSSDNSDLIQRIDNLEKRVKSIEDLIKRMTE